MPTFLYGDGRPSTQAYTGAGAANAANAAQYAAVLAGYSSQLKAQQQHINSVQSGYKGLLGTIDSQIGNVQSGYGDIMNRAQGGYDNILSGIAGLGTSQRQDLQSQFARQQAEAQQSMMSRGLFNTTVLDSAARGINSDEARAQIALEDSIMREKMAIQDQQQQALMQIGMGQMGSLASMYGGRDQMAGMGLQSLQSMYGGYQGIVGNKLNFMGNVNHQAIPNPVIPLAGQGGDRSGGSPYVAQSQARAQAGADDLNNYLATQAYRTPSATNQTMGMQLASAAAQGKQFGGVFGSAGGMGGSWLPPGAMSGGNYVGGGGWQQPGALGQYGYA